MAKNFRIDSSAFDRDLREISHYIRNDLATKSHREYVKNTPVDRGNARRKTRLFTSKYGFEIRADYDYARVLDEGLYPDPPKLGTGKTKRGYSTQAPKGMSRPTLEFIEKDISNYIRKQ